MSMLVGLNHTQVAPKLQATKQVAFQAAPRKDTVSFKGVEQVSKAVPKSVIKNIMGMVTSAVGNLCKLVMKIPQAIAGLVHKL